MRYEVGTMMPLLGSSGAVAPWASPSSAGKLSFRRQRRPCSVSLQLVTARGRLPGTCRRMRLCVPAAGHCAGAAPGDMPPDEASCCCTGTAGCSRSRCSRNARTLSRHIPPGHNHDGGWSLCARGRGPIGAHYDRDVHDPRVHVAKVEPRGGSDLFNAEDHESCPWQRRSEKRTAFHAQGPR